MQSLFLPLALGAAPFLLAVEDPPPQHVQWMKESGQAQMKIRNGEDVASNANRLAAIFKEVEGFWAQRKSEVAVNAARDIQAASAKLAAGDASAGRAVGTGCRTCHDQHREKIADNVYKIK